MPSVTVVVSNPSGLHARPAATFVKAATQFASDLRVTNLSRDPETAASAKSILGVLKLGAVCGHAIRIDAAGDGADEALAELAALVASGLGEVPER